MDISETLYAPNREIWRSWLSHHYQEKIEIWLQFFYKHSGKDNIPYHAAVEEALCFGWIDSVRKKLDQESYGHRFTVRKKGSPYSQTNKERLARLEDQDKLLPEISQFLKENRPETFQIPEDIVTALKANDRAWRFFSSRSAPYQRIRAAYVDSARDRPHQFEKRLKNLLRMSAAEKQFGYYIEDFY